jgi:hypothetical protein
VAAISVAVDISVTLERWILPISVRRSRVIVRTASSSTPASPGAVVVTCRERSPAATALATSAASRIGRETPRATTRATAVTTRPITTISIPMASRC